MSPNAGGGCDASANEYSCAHGVPINIGDLTPYLTYEVHICGMPILYFDQKARKF
jgi:hypothetical protein